MKTVRKILLLTIFSAIFLVPLGTMAASNKPIYSAWVPYWKKTEAAKETIANLSKLGEISPFSYTVKPTGELVDTMKLDSEPWPALLKKARAKKVKILPAIMWSDSVAIDKVLSNANARKDHIDKIMKEVTTRKFDGIDIDYENKYASTSPYFSTFLGELGVKLHAKKKTLSCTIEARTPPDSRFLTVPKVLEYANDFPTINKYCDQVRLMTYDQGTGDIKLNMEKRKGALYYPIADSAWVRKVVELALKDIDANKIMLGVANYGYELEITDKVKFFDYKKIRSLTYKDLQTLSGEQKIKPFRNNAGELSLIYVKAGKIRYVSFSDAQAMADKFAIAKQYNLRGVAIFKIDGEGDKYWEKVK